MRLSNMFIKTLRETPADETAHNARLLTRAGYIHKEMAGAYAYLPLGKLVLDNIAQVIREEMNGIGGEELQMTVLQPKEVWEKTDRWDDEKVDNWFKTRLLNGTELGVGLTHEEPIANMLRPFVDSYRDLPVYVYQIQNKFRNEARARSGILRGREFLMKDLYSFSRNQEEHEAFYRTVTEAYHRIYGRLGIGSFTYYTYADGGIFSDYSHEFQTLSEAGEDTIYLHEGHGVAVNEEVYTPETLQQLQLDKSELVECTAAEVGNIFPLGSKYTDALDVLYTDEDGERRSIVMGSYGIGVSRVMGVLAEVFSDERGLVWPAAVAPAVAHLVALKGGEDQAEAMYEQLREAGVSTLYDDRDHTPGEKLADADLMGMPTRIVCSQKTVEADQVEVTERASGATQMLDFSGVFEYLATSI